jgi:hypothetical protein
MTFSGGMDWLTVVVLLLLVLIALSLVWRLRDAVRHRRAGIPRVRRERLWAAEIALLIVRTMLGLALFVSDSLGRCHPAPRARADLELRDTPAGGR